MSAAKHTPGPWLIEHTGIRCESHIATVATVGEYRVGRWYAQPYQVNYEFHGSDEDDANLIAAAPEMLEALRQIADMDYTRAATNCMGHDAVMLARAAIEKATGQ
ncbi:MAG: hypothetical protein AB7P78_20625 [Candidatus Binatia bacterium]